MGVVSHRRLRELLRHFLRVGYYPSYYARYVNIMGSLDRHGLEIGVETPCFLLIHSGKYPVILAYVRPDPRQSPFPGVVGACVVDNLQLMAEILDTVTVGGLVEQMPLRLPLGASRHHAHSEFHQVAGVESCGGAPEDSGGYAVRVVDGTERAVDGERGRDTVGRQGHRGGVNAE